MHAHADVARACAHRTEAGGRRGVAQDACGRTGGGDRGTHAAAQEPPMKEWPGEPMAPKVLMGRTILNAYVHEVGHCTPPPQPCAWSHSGEQLSAHGQCDV